VLSKMEKYQVALLMNIRKQLQEWFEKSQPVQYQDVKRFLHSLAGTSQTIGLEYLGKVSAELLDGISENPHSTWDTKELQSLLIDIIKICYKDEIVEVEQIMANDKPPQTSASILLIDDDLSILIYLKEQFEQQGWHVFVASNREKAITAFYELKPDCLILDVYMQEEDGFELLSYFNEQARQRFIPTIMISADNSRETRIKAFQMGADDFLAKPLDMEECLVKIERHLERRKLFTEYLLVDELTGAYNRKYLTEVYKQQQTNYIRNKEAYCIAMIDLDHFKKVNDTYGHLMGDEVLQRFVKHVKSNIRTTDQLFRYGGEEFVLHLPRTNAEEAQTTLNRILSSFGKESFHINNQTFFVTFSAGIVEVSSESTLENILNQADRALYTAKEKGRNQVVVSCHHQQMKLKKFNLAIIDDDPIIRTMLTELLGRIDLGNRYEVQIHTYKDGLEFMNSTIINEDTHCFVILDGMMPKMDGLEVLQRLRKEKRHDQFTVVMLTSRNSENDIQRALQLGADDYMTKPFKLMELEARMQLLMKRVK